MKLFFYSSALLLISVVGVNAKAVYKRQTQNSYGDEPVAETTVAPKQEYPQEAAPSEAPVEQVPAETPAPAAPVEQSGYRKRREAQNSYGDEPNATPAATEAPAAETTVQEVAPEAVVAETVAPVDQPPAEKSGYRSKRDAQNSYGDEPVTEAAVTEAPKQEYPQEETSEAPETPAPEVAPEPVHNEPAPQEAPVEHSGY